MRQERQGRPEVAGFCGSGLAATGDCGRPAKQGGAFLTIFSMAGPACHFCAPRVPPRKNGGRKPETLTPKPLKNWSGRGESNP